MATKKKSTNTSKKTAAVKKVKSRSESTRKSAVKKAATAKKATKKAATPKKAVTEKKATVKKKAASHPAKDKKSNPKKATVKKSTTSEKKSVNTSKAKSSARQTTTASKTKPAAKPVKKATKTEEKAAHTAAKAAKQKASSSGSNGKSASSSRSATGKPKFVYKPEPSILDIPKEQPRKRYSDNELQEFKALIQGKLEAAHKELAYLQGLITRKDEAGTDDTENKYMGVEDGGGTMEREQLSQLASRQIQFIDKLEKALQRIENKTYGICRETGKLIDKARLRAVPHATLSIEAKLAKRR